MEEVTFFVEGRPHPQPRPAIVRRTGHVYYPDKAGKLKRWKSAIRSRVTPFHFLGNAMLAVDLVFVITRPMNHWLRNGIELSSVGRGAPHPPYDVDNYAKCVLDELNACGAFTDDRNIVDLRIRKEWQARSNAPTGCQIILRRVYGNT